MQKMTEAEIRAIAETVAAQTSVQATTVVFEDGTFKSVEESWLGYSNIWVVVQGKADPHELCTQMLQSYNEIQYAQGW